MITVHHLNNSRSQRVLWLLEELGLDYTVQRYERDPRTMLAPPQLRAVHPLGKSPVVVDGERVLAESGAIIEYLVQRYGNGRLQPAPDSEDALRYRYWMHYAEASAMPPLLLKLVAQRIASAPIPWPLRPLVAPVARRIGQALQTDLVDPQLALHLGYIDSELRKTGWFAGEEFTAADIQMSFPLEAAQKRAPQPGLTAIADFVQRIHARAAYRRALATGGEYAYA